MNAPITHLQLREGSHTLASASPGTNFLFLSSSFPHGPEDARGVDEKFLASARSMAKEGYVYLADPVQKEVQDDEFGVRHLPLKDALPSFGDLCAVVVLEDEALLQRARQEYPEALAFLYSAASPASVSSTLSAGQRSAAA